MHSFSLQCWMYVYITTFFVLHNINTTIINQVIRALKTPRRKTKQQIRLFPAFVARAPQLHDVFRATHFWHSLPCKNICLHYLTGLMMVCVFIAGYNAQSISNVGGRLKNNKYRSNVGIRLIFSIAKIQLSNRPSLNNALIPLHVFHFTTIFNRNTLEASWCRFLNCWHKLLNEVITHTLATNPHRYFQDVFLLSPNTQGSPRIAKGKQVTPSSGNVGRRWKETHWEQKYALRRRRFSPILIHPEECRGISIEPDTNMSTKCGCLSCANGGSCPQATLMKWLDQDLM